MRAASPVEVLESYTRANAELLGIGDAALVAYASAENRPNALACVVLLYAKEKTGIERARIGAGLAAGPSPTTIDEHWRR